MSVQALISSCASEELPCEMEREYVGRDGSGAPLHLEGSCPQALMTLLWPCQQQPKVSLWFVEPRMCSAEGSLCGQWGGYPIVLLLSVRLLGKNMWQR